MPPTVRMVARPGASVAASRPAVPAHPNDRPPTARPRTSSTGSPKLDKKYQQEQDKLFTRQEQEHRRLQQKQEQEHQRMQARPDEGRRPQLEQRHQQGTSRSCKIDNSKGTGILTGEKSLDDSPKPDQGTAELLRFCLRAKYAALVVKIPSPTCVYQTRHFPGFLFQNFPHFFIKLPDPELAPRPQPKSITAQFD
jgi:hypothetical protein